LKTVALPIIRSHSDILMGSHGMNTAIENKAHHDARTIGAE